MNAREQLQVFRVLNPAFTKMGNADLADHVLSASERVFT
jgi:hypothetical protein